MMCSHHKRPKKTACDRQRDARWRGYTDSAITWLSCKLEHTTAEQRGQDMCDVGLSHAQTDTLKHVGYATLHRSATRGLAKTTGHVPLQRDCEYITDNGLTDAARFKGFASDITTTTNLLRQWLKTEQ